MAKKKKKKGKKKESWSFENDIEVLQSKDSTQEMEKIKQHSLELDKWLEKEELCWQQKSREVWVTRKGLKFQVLPSFYSNPKEKEQPNINQREGNETRLPNREEICGLLYM